MSSNASSWDAPRLQALTVWFGTRWNNDPSAPGSEADVVTIDPASTHGRLLHTFQDLFDRKTTPQATAEILATLVLADDAPVIAWSRMCALFCLAARSWDSTSSLLLIDSLVALASLPHALPYHPDYGPENDSANVPKADFAELPELVKSMDMLVGPKLHVSRLQDVTSQARLAAQERWRKMNFFAANLTLQAIAGSLPECVNFIRHGLGQVAQALEHPITADLVRDFHQITVNYFELGNPSTLRLPAATQWIVIAARELVQCSLESERGTGRGPLWSPAKGAKQKVTVERWKFWQQQLLELTEYPHLLGAKLTAECARAAQEIMIYLPEDDGEASGEAYDQKEYED